MSRTARRYRICRHPVLLILALLATGPAALSQDAKPPEAAAADGASAANAPATPAAQPQTTGDPSVPVDQLRLMLKPLTKTELQTEAHGWIGLLKQQVRRISESEIKVKYSNAAIRTSEKLSKSAQAASRAVHQADAETAAETVKEATAAAREAARAAEEVSDTLEETSADGDESAGSESTEEARQQASEAAEAARDSVAAVSRAADAVDELQQSSENPAGETDGAKDDTSEAPADQDKPEQSQGDVPQEDATDAVEQLGGAAAAAAQAREIHKDDKQATLKALVGMREQRTELIDRVNVVLAELKLKGGDVTDHELYVKAVSGITVDVTDVESTWSSMIGWMRSSEGGLRVARNVGRCLVTIVLFAILAWLIGGTTRLTLRVVWFLTALQRYFLGQVARWAVVIIGLVFALAALEVDIGPLLAVIGAAGFVVAFALQESLGNIASGIMVLLYRPFDVGDMIELAQVSGRVQSMNMVSTNIRTLDNKAVVVPNNAVWRGVITNSTGTDQRRVDMEFNVAPDADTGRVGEILRRIVADEPRVLAEPEPVIRIQAVSGKALGFICRPWAATEDYENVYSAVTSAVKSKFDEAGIVMV